MRELILLDLPGETFLLQIKALEYVFLPLYKAVYVIISSGVLYTCAWLGKCSILGK